MEPIALHQEQSSCLPPYVYYDRLFSPPECAEIIRIGESSELRQATVGNSTNNDYRVDEEIRRVDMRIIEPSEDIFWLYERLRERVEWVNKDQFRFSLSSFEEGIQFLRYSMKGAGKGHYDWHQDFGGGQSSLRKVSVVTQLSPASDYEGCRLELFTSGAKELPHVNQGDVVMFPSWTPHRVTPITRGTRYSLALWVTGPSFR